MSVRLVLVVTAVLAGTAAIARAPSAVPRSVVAAGGGTTSGTNLSLSYTVGQPVVGAAPGILTELHSGFWIRRTATATAVGDVPLRPDEYRLHPNVPNPFNPRTEIRFDLPESVAGLGLWIHDVAGRRVATLAEGPHDAGIHRVVWNGEDDLGRPVASGVYLYRLETPTFTRTEKLALVR